MNQAKARLWWNRFSIMKVSRWASLLLCMALGCHSPRPKSISGGELTIMEVPANLWRGWEAVGGKLTITNQRVVFLPHGVNFHKAPLEIELDSIESVGPIRHQRGLLRARVARVTLRTKTGQAYEFVVKDGEGLVGAIFTQRSKGE